MSVVFTVDSKSFDKEFINSLALRNNATQIRKNLFIGKQSLDQVFEKMKESMIREFIAHPVTKEILAGPGASNISGTLSGYGNLFSFIGFNKGEDPIYPIIKLLEQSHLIVSRFSNRKTLKITIELPSPKQIFSVTPMPWATGLSWAQRIELGMSGYPNYIAREKKGRSGGGIQAEESLFTGKFRNVKYISHFINTWEKKFLKIFK